MIPLSCAPLPPLPIGSSPRIASVLLPHCFCRKNKKGPAACSRRQLTRNGLSYPRVGIITSYFFFEETSHTTSRPFSTLASTAFPLLSISSICFTADGESRISVLTYSTFTVSHYPRLRESLPFRGSSWRFPRRMLSLNLRQAAPCSPGSLSSGAQLSPLPAAVRSEKGGSTQNENTLTPIHYIFSCILSSICLSHISYIPIISCNISPPECIAAPM